MKKDIAIIGMSGRFPKSENISDFWDNLTGERELVHFFSEEELKVRGVTGKELKDPNFVRAAAYIDRTDEFDYPFFKYTFDEALVMNPQTRLFHQLVWQAMEDAGCDPERYRKKIGIFVGANRDLNWSLYTAMNESANVDALTSSKLSNPNFIASLIAYRMNFRGPCYFIDTACSTSLSAAHLACRSLLLNECGIAVAGGIRLLSFEDNGYTYQEGSIMAADGHCRSFDHRSTGTMGCDGAGVVILKRLEAAIREKDHIYAVIRASAMNNDGSMKAGYTMPSVQGQAECIRLAQKIAGVEPRDITYVETHGTGTKIGDPIEVEALNLAFNYDTGHQCAIGSVKSNMGHADEAAGIAGLLKAGLALRHKVLPASLHFERANPTIPFDKGPFYVNTATRTWEENNGKPLMAAVSSLGIGGTNVHMILEEAPSLPESSTQKVHHLIRFSAESEEALRRYESELLDFMKSRKSSIELANLAFTLITGRKSWAYRKSFSATGVVQAADILQGGNCKTCTADPKQHLVFMFSGQGSQYFNMGLGLYCSQKYFRKICDQGFDYLREWTSVDFKSFLYGEEDLQHRINCTEYTQPLLFLFEYSLARLLMHFGLKPDYLIGHSLGEFVAACISGVFTFESALRLVFKRGELMAAQPEGAMLSVGLPLEDLDQGLLKNVSVAAVNAPRTVVLSGDTDEIAQLRDQLTAKGIPAVILKTSHAFHSDSMKVIRQPFGELLEQISCSPPTIPFISNVTGRLITEAEACSVAYWKEHIVRTVNFEKGIRTLTSLRNSLFVEVGPGKTLSTFCRQSQKRGENNVAVQTIRHPKDPVGDDEFFNTFLGKLWCHGYDIDWSKYYEEDELKKIPAPVYVFDQHQILSKVSADRLLQQEGFGRKFLKNGPAAAFYLPSWKQELAVEHSDPELIAGQDCLFFSDCSELADLVLAGLQKKYKNVVEISTGVHFKAVAENRFTINFQDTKEYLLLAEHLRSSGIDYDRIVYCRPELRSSPGMEMTMDYEPYIHAFNNLLDITRAFDFRRADHHQRLVVISCNAARISGYEDPSVPQEHLNALLISLVREYPGLYAGTIDLDPEAVNEDLVDRLLSELDNSKKHQQVAFRKQKRYVPHFDPVICDPAAAGRNLRVAGHYLVTAAHDETDFALIQYLLQSYQARVSLLRIEQEELSDMDADRFNTLRSLPGEIRFVNCDPADYESLSATVKELEAGYGPLNGLIHTARFAGLEGMVMADDLTPDTVARHFRPRVNGILNLLRIFRGYPLDFVRVMSSLSTFLGGAAYAAYAAAGALMEELLIRQIEDYPQWAIINLDRVSKQGEGNSISPENIPRILEQSLQLPVHERLVVAMRDLNVPWKADRKPSTLPNAALNRVGLQSEFKAATTETENALLTLFGELFGLQGIGIADDFFDLGGDSLKGMMLINKIEKELQVKLAVSDIFSNPTPASLAALIDEKRWLSEDKQMLNELTI